MESDRCIAKVKEELNRLGLHFKSVELGEVDLPKGISNDEMKLIAESLSKSGLELIISNNALVANKIKEAINELVYSSDDLRKPNFSEYISKKVNYNYNYLSKIFTEIEDITIEKYFITLRIERVKEMIIHGGHSLSEIAYKLLYSSVAHLSNQFKKVTGLTPFNYRQLEGKKSNNTVCV
jgi:YesN/AraC family two-component response regulator